MLKVFKYLLSVNPARDVGKLITIRLPMRCSIIAFGVQDKEIVLWAEVDPKVDKIPFAFTLVWTGDEVPTGNYRHTLTLSGLVYHIYGGYVV